MAHDKTPEEVHNEYLQSMGPELGRLFYELFNEVSRLHLKWEQYRELFGKNPEQIETLNQVAPLFFGIVQRAIFDDVLLQIARLTDSPSSFGRDNLSLKKLLEMIDDETLKGQVELSLGEVNAACESARRVRNRRLAHSDLSSIRAQSQLPGISRQYVEEALARIREMLNSIELHFRGSKVGYEIILDPGGAESLVYYIEKGLEAEEASMQALFARKTSPT